MSIEQSVIFCDYNTRLMDVPKSCFLPNKIGHKTTKKFVRYCNTGGPPATQILEPAQNGQC